MMYTVLPELYLEVLARLCDAIDGEHYFSGTVAFRFCGADSCSGAEHPGPCGSDSAPDGVDCRLTLSVIVYRRRVSQPEGVANAISDLIPVWWEFHTSDAGGELLNDFSFSDMKCFL